MNDEVAESTQRYLDAWEKLKAHDDRLGELRRGALARFAERGFPGTRVEEWKYTNLRPLERRKFELAQELPANLPEAASLPLADAGLPTVAFVNGQFAAGLSRRLDGLPDGIQVRSIAALLDEQPEALQPHLEAAATANDNVASTLAELNTAFFIDGAVIDIAADTCLDQPLHVLFISQQADASVVSHPRVIVNAGRGSEVSIVEHHIGIDDAVNFSNSVAQIVLHDNAALRHYRVQQENARSFHISNARVWQSRDSRYLSLNIDLGGMLVRHDLHAYLAGTNAEAILDGLFVLGGRQHCDNHTYVNHIGPHTRSREHYKGILGDHSRGVFNGKVYVEPGAQKTDSNQTSHNLLLSDNAEIDTKPELEIYADDVKCNHGATVGQLDETALFYLRSRGLGADEARRLLITAFAREMLDSIEAAPVKKYLENALAVALGGYQG
ncbi:MAG TPA: Fe-S cluster assembly protein SufD [Gammaproteobacteria bacterium]|nr:Fe-S cluster assembly protein SufD [Gammaproteobacteria bacterium]